MRLARWTLVCALTVLALCAVAAAQASGQEADARGKRNQKPQPNHPPDVTLTASSGTITLPCMMGEITRSCTPNADQTVRLTANSSDSDGDTLIYRYTATGGRVTGEGTNATWDLASVQPGTYTATVGGNDGHGSVVFSNATVRVVLCECDLPCPTISISCPTDIVEAGTPATVSVNLSGGDPNVNVNYNWTVSAGTITRGQGTHTITVDTTGLEGKTVTATMEIGGLPPECDRARSCTFSVQEAMIGDIPCRKFDEYEALGFKEEIKRLDNLALQLRQAPGAHGYYLAFGSCEGEADQRAARAIDYLIKEHGIDRSRVSVFNGGCRETFTVELWICAEGADRPYPSNMATVSPCPVCRKARTAGRHRR